MSLTGAAKLAGVVGWPVTHSLSPRLHAYWLAEYKVDGAFVPLAIRREDFSAALNGLRLAGFRGVNVTVPHKEAAFAVAHAADAAASTAGAANLLTFESDGRILARNTDSTGLTAQLAESLGPAALKGKCAVLLGAGGAARAAVLALETLGASEIRIVNRNGARAGALAAALQPNIKARLAASDLTQWKSAAQGADIVVNATSAGMKGNPPLVLGLEAMAKDAVVCDLVYNPLETDLLKHAKAQGHKTVDGLGMLLHQAVPAFEAFFGVTPKVTPGVRSILEKALGQ
jgi:shikimate dehydrogenase